MTEQTTTHTGRLRPVTRDGGKWRALPLIRGVWDDTPADVWMLWCGTCRAAIEGTAFEDSANCDIDDLLPRMSAFTDWEKACIIAHQSHLAH